MYKMKIPPPNLKAKMIQDLMKIQMKAMKSYQDKRKRLQMSTKNLREAKNQKKRNKEKIN